MSSSIRGATATAAAAALLLLAACEGGRTDDAPGAAAPSADTSARTVAAGPAAAFDSAVAAGSVDAATVPLPGAAPAPGESRRPPERPAPPNPITPDEAQRYPLTMERIRQLARAGEELARVQRSNPAMRDSMAVAAPEPNAIMERLTNVPDARAAVARAGMSPREYTLTTMALMQAAMVGQMRQQGLTPPIPAHEENVRLVTENFEEIQRLMQRVAEQAPQQ